MSEAIKAQVMLNKDWDLGYFLEAAESEMAYWGSTQDINITNFNDMGAILSPTSFVDIFRSIIPKVAMINRVIHRNFRALPQYLITGLRTGAMLESMQKWSASIPNYSQGKAGYTAENPGAIIGQTILTSPAIGDNKIYVAYKAPGDNLSRSVIIDFVYKPLYIVEEITNSMKRTFVKSRTALEICQPQALGVLNVEGLTEFLGPDKVLP